MDRERSFIVCILFGLLLLSIFFLFQQNIDVRRYLVSLTSRVDSINHILIHQTHEIETLRNELENERNKKEWWETFGEKIDNEE